MVCAALFFWLLVARLGPHACGQGAPDQGNHPIPVTPPAFSTFLNSSHLVFSLYKQMVAANPGKNILFSPLGFSIPLTLLALQARSAARTQVLEGLGFPLVQVPDSMVHEHYSRQLLAPLRSLEACRPDTGSVLFVDQRQYLFQSFVDIAQRLYHTKVILIPFGNKQAAREEMDRFASEITHSEIESLLERWTPNTALILTNYMFFKGKWKVLFDPKRTELRPFSVSEGVSVLVPTMQRPGWFQIQRFYHLHSYVLRLPSACNTIAVFILPDAGKTGEAEEALKRQDFGLWTQPFPLSRRRLYLPKFSLSGSTRLEQLLPAVGLADIFNQGAEIRGISPQINHMKISKAAHRAELTMDEKGEEAEDASRYEYLPRSHLSPFHFNRPFLLLLFKEDSHTLLFMGRVTNPIAKA